MLDIEPYNKFDDSVLSSSFETNLSDEDIWKLVDCIINHSDTDAQIIYTKAKLKKMHAELQKLYWKICKKVHHILRYTEVQNLIRKNK